MPETYVMDGRTYLIESLRIDKAIEMFEKAQYLYPPNLQIRMNLAEAYARVARNDDAIRTAEIILSWVHGDNGPAQFAKELIGPLTGDASVASDSVKSAEP